jgi:hypothetical protein
MTGVGDFATTLPKFYQLLIIFRKQNILEYSTRSVTEVAPQQHSARWVRVMKMLATH